MAKGGGPSQVLVNGAERRGGMSWSTRAVGWLVLTGLVASSAIVAKEFQAMARPLVAMMPGPMTLGVAEPSWLEGLGNGDGLPADPASTDSSTPVTGVVVTATDKIATASFVLPSSQPSLPDSALMPPVIAATTADAPAEAGANPPNEADAAAPDDAVAADPTTRWFNGRPVRPARTIVMTVTGYSPDARSCGESADGLTATLHHVTTNAGKLVAADPRILPYGSIVSVPGYKGGGMVPVLDCGSAIKGYRLDALFATHEEAQRWGKKRIRVTVWEYADGKPRENPRRER